MMNDGERRKAKNLDPGGCTKQHHCCKRLPLPAMEPGCLASIEVITLKQGMMMQTEVLSVRKAKIVKILGVM